MTSYDEYLKAKLEPQYCIKNRMVIIKRSPLCSDALTMKNESEDYLFDYQKFIVGEAIKRQKYAIFADCGLGKTAMFLAWIRRILPVLDGKKVRPTIDLTSHAFSDADLRRMFNVADTQEKAILATLCSLGWEVSSIISLERLYIANLIFRAQEQQTKFIYLVLLTFRLFGSSW